MGLAILDPTWLVPLKMGHDPMAFTWLYRNAGTAPHFPSYELRLQVDQTFHAVRLIDPCFNPSLA